MLILGIETATQQVSVALGGHEGVIGLFEVARGRRHAEILTPASSSCARQADIGLDELGLDRRRRRSRPVHRHARRAAAAKALALALRLPMIGISSLDLLAFRHRRSDRSWSPSSTPARVSCSTPCTARSPAACSRSSRRGSGPSTSSSPTSWRAARRRCASATGRCATGADPRGLPLRDRRRPVSVRRLRSCSSPTPRRCARTG